MIDDTFTIIAISAAAYLIYRYRRKLPQLKERLKITNCKNCQMPIGFFKLGVECYECGKKGCKSCFKKCEDCEGYLCSSDIEKHVQEEKQEEGKMEKCKDCGKELNDDNTVSCDQCDNGFCEDCTEHCGECDGDFCQDCYGSNDHECDVGFEVWIALKNSNDMLKLKYDSKKESTDAYARIKTSMETKRIAIEESNCFILVDEIKYVDLRW